MKGKENLKVCVLAAVGEVILREDLNAAPMMAKK